MEVNKKILKIGLICIGLVLSISLIFALYIKLDTPVVLKSYIEERVNTNKEDFEVMQLQMIYITNVYDEKEIHHIEMTDNKKTTKLLGRSIDRRSQNYGLYRVNTVYLQINKNDNSEDLGGLEFNRAKVGFNTGDTIDVDLGRVILYKDDLNTKNLEHSSSSSSSDGSSSNTLITKGEIKLTKLESPLFEDSENFYDIQIDDTDYKEIAGIVYGKEKVIRIKSKFKIDNNILNKYTQFNLQPRLYFKDRAGEEEYTNIYNIMHIPYEFSFTGIFKYLKARGGI